ncbi:putative lipoprotein [Leptospira ryugenii]|uniref:Putative lipoprotein n=1 Tax=Leptospira ryugenii TaxID=1917863 RepID=A0A2P2DYB8_9LEPT|nr:hypothetical protein [Leptospira ryugenii]GBF49600.1 putative lipoprotein [Leptospira ryugenii]
MRLKQLWLLFFILLSFTFSCIAEKDLVSEADLSRALERFAETRIQTGLMTDPKKTVPTDKELFEEACSVYRLPIAEAKSLLLNKNPKLYHSIYGN